MLSPLQYGNNTLNHLLELQTAPPTQPSLWNSKPVSSTPDQYAELQTIMQSSKQPSRAPDKHPENLVPNASVNEL